MDAQQINFKSRLSHSLSQQALLLANHLPVLLRFEGQLA
jgi:hypothetical protein